MTRRSPRPQTLEALESRQLFAVFNGTPGNDLMIAYVDPNGISHVVVNGVDQMTFDAQLDIIGQGGNDTIYINKLRPLTLASINPGEGVNQVYVGGGDFDTNIQGNVDVLGHLGTDTLTVEDNADGPNDFDYYELTNFTFRKPTSSGSFLSYFSVDQLIVNASPQTEGAKIISTSASSTLTWNGNGGNDTIYLGDGDLGLIRGPVHLRGNAGNDTVAVYDHSAPGPEKYEIYNNTIERDGLADWELDGSVEALALIASQGDDTINFRTSSGSINTSAGGNNGNDTFNLFTDGYTDPSVQKLVAVYGDNGSDTINWNVQSGDYVYRVEPIALYGSMLPTYGYNQMETINVNGGSENETYVVHGTRPATHVIINAGKGNDAISLGGSFGQPYTLDDIDSPITVNGDDGFDVVDFIDNQTTTAQTYSLTDSTITRTNMPAATYGTVEHVTIHGGSNIETFNVNSTPADVQFLLKGNGSGDTFNVNETAPGGAVTIDAGANFNFVNVNTDGVGSAEARFVSSQDLASLNIGAGGLAVIDPNGETSLLTRGLSIETSGRLDLTDNLLLVDYTPAGGSPAEDVRSWLIAGRNQGGWDGTSGIVSSSVFANPGTGIGYAESFALGGQWGGPHVDPHTLIVRYTLNGDADLDRSVNITDFTRLAANFNMTSKIWIDGDFNYDGNVNLTDFTLLAGNFGVPFAEAGTIAHRGGSREIRRLAEELV